MIMYGLMETIVSVRYLLVTREQHPAANAGVGGFVG